MLTSLLVGSVLETFREIIRKQIFLYFVKCPSINYLCSLFHPKKSRYSKLLIIDSVSLKVAVFLIYCENT